MIPLFEDVSKHLAVAILSIIVTAVIYIKWSLLYWNRKNVTTPPVNFFTGNAKELLLQKCSIAAHLKNIYDIYKPTGLRYCGYYFFTIPQLMVFDLDLIKTIMTKDFLHFTDHGRYVNEEVDPLSGHLFALTGLKWKNLRAKLTPTFTSDKIKMMFQTMESSSEQLMVLMDELTEKGQTIDIKEIVGRFTTDIIGACAFGIECNSLKNPDAEFRNYGKKVFDVSFFELLKQMIGQFAPGVLDFFKMPFNKPEVTKFFIDVVNETVQCREKDNIVLKNFMHLLIQLTNNVKIIDEANAGRLYNGKNGTEVEKSLTLEEIAAQAFVFFVAGFETSSTTTTLCFYELACNLDVQEKLRKEINDTLERYDGELTYDAIMTMTYMDQCIKETLRKYPPLPVLSRECTQTYKIPSSDVVLEKGLVVMIPIIGIQHDPMYYPDPEKFDPERFRPEIKSRRHPCTWIPFGEGPRSCIGQRFGIMQTKVALAVLLRNYKFTLNVKTETPLVMDPRNAIPTASGGVWLNADKVD